MKVVDFLKSAKQWTRDVYARREDGRSVGPRSKYAVKFCLRGAIDHCYRHQKQRDEARDKLLEIIGGGITVFNDDPKTTFRDVRSVLKEADV